MPTLAELEAELRIQDGNLKEVEEILSLMPDSAEALEMKAQVLTSKREIQNKIAQLKPGSTAHTESSTPPPPPAAIVAPPPPPPSTSNPDARVFKRGENIMAKYSGDRQFYPAKVVEVMGSASAPLYMVQFKGYTETETVRAHEVRALPSSTSTSSSAGQKRTSDAISTSNSAGIVPSPSESAPAKTISSGSVLSAPAAIDTNLAASLRQPRGIDAPGDKSDRVPGKKIKTNKALDKAKGNWQDWQKKSSAGKIAKVANKESMFRTGEGHAAKVGFTGSGGGMRKDAVRGRHVYADED